MAWARIDDNANADPKLLALSDGAHRMWTCGNVYCQKSQSEGFIPRHVVHTFGVRAPVRRAVAELCAPLIEGKKPLWHRVDGGFQINDYLDWNDPREVLDARKEKAKERLRRWRMKRQGNALQNAEKRVSSRLETRSETRCETGIPVPVPSTNTRTQEQEHKTSVPTTSVPVPISSSPLVVSPLRFEKAKQSFAFYGDRLKVPHVLHREFADKLGRHAEQLPAWYQRVNAEAGASGEAIPDVFLWLRPKFVAWAQSMVGGDELAKFVRGEV